MITCFIRYEIAPFKCDAFEIHARKWGEVIPRGGADLADYFVPHEGSNTVAYTMSPIWPPMRSIAPVCSPILWVRKTMNSPGRNSSSAAKTGYS